MPFHLVGPAGIASERESAARLATLRWLTVAAMTAVTLLAPSVLGIALPALPLLTVAAVTAAANLALLGGRRLRPGYTPPAAAQLAFDLLAWSAYIYFTGGATNPLISILLPLVAIGAAVLPERQAWGLGALSIFAYAFLWEFYQPLVVADTRVAVRLHLLGMWLTFAVSVAVAVWFIARMTAAVRVRDRALAAAREAELRNDWIVSLGSLAAGAAHELSTPLATLSLLVEELLCDPAVKPPLRGELELMAVQVGVCKRALTRLTARAGRARAEKREACPVAEWLGGLAHEWQALHPAAELRLRSDPSLEGVALVPDLSLERAVHNLVDNAVAASPAGVEVSARSGKGVLEIVVADRGPGLADEALARLSHPAPQGGGDGLGIGLQLTRGTIERYAGELRFAPRPEGGTTATVRLPLARLQPP